MSTDKSKKPADTGVRADSMTTKHLMEHLTTAHLKGALKPAENPKPVPSASGGKELPASALKPEKK